MTKVTMLSLDVLKPHQPSKIIFATNLAEKITGSCVVLKLIEMDEKTETLQLQITAPTIDIHSIEHEISEMGASLHSIDEVRVEQDDGRSEIMDSDL